MSVFSKLQQARTALSKVEMKKSGHNKFAGYSYFELGDFIQPIQAIFTEVGLHGYVSFGVELATLTIVDLDTGEKMQITSPMSTAALKGCHEVQNLGAVQTYLRRYLWVAALEIVEHDPIDSSEPLDEAAVLLAKYQEAASFGMDALQEFHSKQAATAVKKAVWGKHHESLKSIAQGVANG